MVAEQYQLRVVIRNMLLLREQLVPGMLHVVDHEGDELNFLLLPRFASWKTAPGAVR